MDARCWLILQRRFEKRVRRCTSAPGILRFYHKSGFRASHRVKDFFTDNDDKTIIEEGVQLRDMVYLRRGANDV